MAAYTLGLDLGSNSIGWAVIDEENQRIIDAGVRVFPEGVDRDQQGGEQSKSEQRRIARGMRRQIARRSRRKRVLRRTLVEIGLLPDAAAFAAADLRRVQWECDQFGKDDPYALRSRALRERLELHEIGRILMHLNQRRGFLSNKKADRQNKKESSEMLEEISTLAAAMGDRSLGKYLADLKDENPHTRLRGRHTRRDMLQDEFAAIWESQRKFHGDVLTDELCFGRSGRETYPREPKPVGRGSSLLLEYGLYGIIFFQRPMYWPKSVVGACELEPKKKRCPKADRLAQRFRLLQEVNNLRVIPPNDEPCRLADECREKLIAYLARSKERTFDEIRKHLGFLEGFGFNLEVGDRRKLLGMPTDAILARKDLFGKNWHSRPDTDRTSIVQTLLGGDEEAIRGRAVSEWDVDGETTERLLEVDFGEGYASYSREAIENLLPYLERGLPLMSRDGELSALQEAGYLRPDQHVVNQKTELPHPPDVTNPLVRHALHEVRKVVNAIIREYGEPKAIHIELAREVKGTGETRRKITLEMRDRERRRDAAAERIKEHGEKVTREKY